MSTQVAAINVNVSVNHFTIQATVKMFVKLVKMSLPEYPCRYPPWLHWTQGITTFWRRFIVSLLSALAAVNHQ